MSNITNTNPLPWKHTHVVSDIVDADSIKNRVKSIVVLNDENDEDHRCLYEEWSFSHEWLTTIDAYKANNYQKIKDSTEDLNNHLKEWDIVCIVYCSILGDSGINNIILNWINLDISDFYNRIRPGQTEFRNLVGICQRENGELYIKPLRKDEVGTKTKWILIYLDDSGTYRNRNHKWHISQYTLDSADIDIIKGNNWIIKLNEYLTPGDLVYISDLRDNRTTNKGLPITIDGIRIPVWVPNNYNPIVWQYSYSRLYQFVKTRDPDEDDIRELVPIQDNNLSILDANTKKETQVAVGTEFAIKHPNTLYFITET